MDAAVPMHEKLHQAKITRPFVPIKIVMDDGEKVPVGQPSLFGFSEDHLVVAVPKRGFLRFPMYRVKALEVATDHAA